MSSQKRQPVCSVAPSASGVLFCNAVASSLARRYADPKVRGSKPRSGQIVYFRGVKTNLSTLGTGDVPRGSDSTQNSRACL